MGSNPSVFKDRLREARIHRGYTQEELAKKVGYGATAITNLETGDNKRSTRTVALALALDCNPEWLEFGNGSPDYDKPRGVDFVNSAYEILDNEGRELLVAQIEVMLNLQQARQRKGSQNPGTSDPDEP